MRKWRKILIAAVVMAACGMDGTAAQMATWEEVSSPRPAVVQSFDTESEVSIVVADGYIYISSEKPVTVKIFSILGQLISRESLKPGMHRIKLESRGIYILRAGSTTRRITL